MIKNIIFDLGVVLLDVNYQNTIQAFSSLGMKNPDEAFSKQRQDDFFRKYERGLIKDDEFLNGLSKRMGVSDQDKVKDAWCSMLGHLPKEKYEVIRKLSQSYKLFILSNTNRIHQAWFEKEIDDQYGWETFSTFFEFIGYSHQINERKPDREAFQYILDQYDLDPEETLFVDDTLDHVKGAQRLGIHASHYSDGEDLEELVMAFLKRGFTSF